MTDPATIARELAISVEAKLTGFAKRADGGVNLRFQVHPNDVRKELRDAPLGTRYVMALVEVDDDGLPVQRKDNEGETPVPAPLTAGPDGQAGRITSVSESRRGEPSPPKPVAADKRLSRRAGILCADQLYRKWLAKQSGLTEITKDEAAAHMRTYCGVTTRTHILPGTPAALKFEELEGRYKIWLHNPELEAV